jgi:hypothetical protein
MQVEQMIIFSFHVKDWCQHSRKTGEENKEANFI